MTATAVTSPARTLKTAAERLWAHGEGAEVHMIPKSLCFALATQFDVAVDEWRYSEEGQGMENMERNVHVAECALRTLDEQA